MLLKLHSTGPAVAALITDLRALGYYTGPEGQLFDAEVRKAVRAFQMQKADRTGRPLVVDGIVGEVTQWALDAARGRVPAAEIAPAAAISLPASGGSVRARAVLAVALAEYHAGHGEEGGNNRGPHVRKYLNELAAEGSDWCAGFVSWCFSQSGHPMPFKYSVGARDVLAQLKKAGFAVKPSAAEPPQPGDVIVWWRVAPTDWRGHIGLVLDYQGGVLRTIEGNKTAKVGVFSYTFEKIDKLLGFARA